MVIDLAFRVTAGKTIPWDNGYLTYSGISRLLPELHESNGIGIHPIQGRLVSPRQVILCPWSRLVLRADAERIPLLLRLTGTEIDVSGSAIRIGVPTVEPIVPAPALNSRLVTIKGFLEAELFIKAVRRQLDLLHIGPEPAIILGKRRTMRIKDKEIVGHEVTIDGLTAEESLQILSVGVGGRRHMGAGLFTPLK